MSEIQGLALECVVSVAVGHRGLPIVLDVPCDGLGRVLRLVMGQMSGVEGRGPRVAVGILE